MIRRVLFIGRFTGFAGGIERYAYAAANRLKAEGVEVDWVGCEKSRDEEIFRRAFHAVHAGVPEGDYDEVVIHKLPSLKTLRELKARFGEKLVFFAHDHDLYCPRRHYYTPFGRRNCHRAYSPFRCLLCSLVTSPRNWPRVFAARTGAALSLLRDCRARVISRFMKENLVKNAFRAEKIEIVAPEVPQVRPLKRYSPVEGRPIRLLFVGQLIAGKGCDLFLEVLSLLAARGVKYAATVVGAGKDLERLERAAKARELNVEFTGWTEDPSPYYDAADLTLFTSRWQEPYGLVGAESIARGVPVVAFKVGGVEEWLLDGVNGRLVEEGNVEAMAAAVAEYAASGSLKGEK